jgi:hypothetical protein
MGRASSSSPPFPSRLVLFFLSFLLLVILLLVILLLVILLLVILLLFRLFFLNCRVDTKYQ